MNRQAMIAGSFLAFFFIITHLLPIQEVFAKDTIVLCRVSENPKKHIDQLQPIADYLAGKLKHLGIMRGEVRFARNNQEVINLLKERKVDLVTETPFSAILFEKEVGAEPLLLRWKKGVSQYHSIIFSKQSSDIRTVNDLVGKLIAFEDKGSTSGFMLPLASLLQQGLNLVELSSPRDEVPEDMVGYVFANQELNISNMVYREITQAGAISNLDWEETDRVNDKMKSEFTVLHRTQDVPRAIELVRGDLDRTIKEAIVDILTHAHEDPEAVAALKAYKKTKKFEKIDGQTSKDLESIRKLIELLTDYFNR